MQDHGAPYRSRPGLRAGEHRGEGAGGRGVPGDSRAFFDATSVVGSRLAAGGTFRCSGMGGVVGVADEGVVLAVLQDVQVQV